MDLDPIGLADRASGRVGLHRRVGASPPRVWQALTSAAGLATWLGRPQGRGLGPGVRFGLWHEEQVRSEHVVLEWVPLRLLAVTWDFPGEAVSRVRWALEGQGDGSAVAVAVAVAHEGVTDPVAYAAGWHIHLDSLAASVAGSPRAFDSYEALQQDHGGPAR